MASRSTKTIAVCLISAAIGAAAITAWSALTMPSAVATATRPAAGRGPNTLTQGPSTVVLGNPQGDVTVIEYFDYQCPVCRKVHPFVAQLIAEDKNIRLVHKHWPVFGDASIYASKVALAARWQGRYEQAHDALMNLRGRFDKDQVREAAVSAGVDMAQVARDLDARAAEIDAALREASKEAAMLVLQGTPGFVIGNYLIRGGLDLAAMREIVAEFRAKQAADQPE